MVRIFHQFGRYFVDKILTQEESRAEITPQYLAGRWAAKEAIVKAFGSGFNKELRILNLAVLNHENGRPFVKVFGVLRKDVHLSISHDHDYAIAVAMVSLTTSQPV
jgi:holo-[acyl-carrier protein] synthase